ncbi:hypothetical protein CDIK_3204, partial [Cucumispora dikerogammari]
MDNNNNKLTIIKSNRGVDKILHEEFIYNYNVSCGNIKKFRCISRQCTGFLFINGEKIVESGSHIYPLDNVKVEQTLLKHKIKTRIISNKENINTVVVDEMHNAPREIITEGFRSIKGVRDTMKRVKNKTKNFVNGAITDIPKTLRRTEKGDLFLHFDSGYNTSNRFIIFFTEFKKKTFSLKTIFLADGTFKITFHGFYQVLIISSVFLGKTFPYIYVLISGKSEQEYTDVFAKIFDLTGCKHQTVVSDFELGLFSALKKNPGTNKIQLCLFHFGQ